jgi:hypothetical protein
LTALVDSMKVAWSKLAKEKEKIDDPFLRLPID